MKTLRVSLAQINTTVGDLEGNTQKAIKASKEATAQGSGLVVFPELAITGYPPEDLLLKKDFLKKSMESLMHFAVNTADICAVIGFAEEEDGKIYNSAAVAMGGKIQCVYRKMFLPNYGVFDEKRYFTPGTEPMYFVLGGIKTGLNICEDTWIEEGPFRKLCSSDKVEILLNLSASPFQAGKMHQRAEMLSKRAWTYGMHVVYTNLVGGQDELVFDGGSLIYDAGGNLVARAPSFTESILTVDIDIEEKPEKGLCPECCSLPLTQSTTPPVKPSIAPELSRDEEIYRALVLGTRDYLFKNGFGKAVIGLSGGIDSSLVAAVAVDALGNENVTGVTMPSHYTSGETRADAEILARNLGIRFVEMPITKIYDSFIQTLSGVFMGTSPDVTEENLQSRIRGTLMMSLSNKFNCLVLTTGNKSEMATGYATLYGDMAGGFAVLKDVPKMDVYRLSRLVNELAGSELIPKSIIKRPPSAELRPDQLDSDSLPPYEILDPILKAYIEDDMGVEEITAIGFDRDTILRVTLMVDRSEYKRRQAPPGVKITPRAFGRDRRLPVTNRYRP